MAKILFFNPYFCGHSLEYTNHLLNFTPRDNNRYIFVLGYDFQSEIRPMKYPNAEIKFMSTKETHYVCDHGFYVQGYYYTSFLNSLIKKLGITRVYLNSFDAYYPFLPFCLIKGVSYVGIYYYIYLYDWFELSFLKRVYHSVLMWMMAKSPATKNLYICNDSSAACFFNKIFHTNKFHRLDDPFNSFQVSKTFDFREKYNIGKKILYIHFGVLSARKGTWDIIKAIELANKEDLKNSVFVFAGNTESHLFDKLNELAKKFSENVLFFPGFCENEFLASMCSAANCILMPYKENSQSSGMLGYASQLGIPVIARNSKLIAKLVKKYKLGFLIESNEELLTLISSFSSREIQVPKRYLEDNSPKRFAQTIFSAL